MRKLRWESVSDLVPVPEVFTESREFISGLILNFALILGVVVFQWNLVEIAVIYIIEVAIVHFSFLTVALFMPQPVADRDGDAWETEPTPIQPFSFLPPIYWRNIKFVGTKAVFTGVFIFLLIDAILPDSELGSALPLSVGVAITSIVLFQLRRVWRHFIVDGSYQQKSPKDAMQFAFAPVVELFFILLFVIVPVTFVVGGVAIAMDTEITSRLVLLVYLVPMGVIRAWIGSLDPQTDDLEISFT